MAVVYRHRRLDTFEIFYIGISRKLNRPYDFNKRSRFWKFIYAKTDILVEIVASDLSYEDAKELDILLIQEYGRRDINTGILCNLTDGGDGSLGNIHTQEFKDNLGNLNKKRLWTEESKRRLRETQINKGNIKVSLVLDLSTGIYYNSIKEASTALNIRYANLKDWLGRYSYRNKTNLIVV